MKKWTIILLIAVIALAVVPLLVAAGGDFGGSDDKAETAITEIDPGYTPWFSSIWEPPSGEIESLLFALQAAIGAGLVFYALGYYMGRAKGRAQAGQQTGAPGEAASGPSTVATSENLARASTGVT
jgi:cobalt/nickel transport protein